ncbi:hypothetical protein ACFL40_05405 [candidate division KSB1 bacterium]
MKKLLLILVLIFLFLGVGSTFAQNIVTGYVIKIESNLLYFDRGTVDNVNIGDEFSLLRDLPDGRMDKNIGVIEITQVFPEMSIGKLKSAVPGEKPSVLDKVKIAPVVKVPDELKNLEQKDKFLAPIIHHSPIKTAKKGGDIDVIVRAHAYQDLKDIFMAYRAGALQPWGKKEMLSYQGDVYFSKIPKEIISGDSVHYYVKAVDVDNRSYSIGNPSMPLSIFITTGMYQSASNKNSALSFFKNKEMQKVLIPGYVQLKRNETAKGYAIIGLQAATILGGIIADKNNGLYFGCAGLVYAYNIFDALFYLKKK